MEEEKFDLVFRGEVLPGRDLEFVKRSVAERFKVPPGRIEEYFSGSPVTLARGVDAPTAARYRASLEATGATCEVVPQGAQAAGIAPPAVLPRPAAVPAPTMACPKCGFQQPQADECSRCGIVIGRFAAGPQGPPPSPAPRPAQPLGVAPPSDARKGFFQNPINLLLAGVLGALVLAILGGILFKVLGPKNPPRAEYLKVADEIMATADSIFDTLDTNPAFSDLSKTDFRSSPGTGLSNAQMGAILRETTSIFTGKGSQVASVQKTLEDSGTPQRVHAEMLRLRSAVDELKKASRRGSKEHRACAEELAGLLDVFDQVSKAALDPTSHEDIIRYHGNCTMTRILLVGLYAAFVDDLRGMKIKETENRQLAFETEERTAAANLERYGAQNLLR